MLDRDAARTNPARRWQAIAEIVTFHNDRFPPLGLPERLSDDGDE